MHCNSALMITLFCYSVVDKCKSNPCRNGGRCETIKNDFKCHCKIGFSGKFCGGRAFQKESKKLSRI